MTLIIFAVVKEQLRIMAKIEEWISDERLSLTRGEIAEFLSRTSTLIEKYMDGMIMNYWTTAERDILWVSFKANDVQPFRNDKRELVDCNEIKFLIGKIMGHTETGIIVQYSAHIFIDGNKRPYRSKIWRKLTKSSIYRHGTELDDIDYEPILKEMFSKPQDNKN